MTTDVSGVCCELTQGSCELACDKKNQNEQLMVHVCTCLIAPFMRQSAGVILRCAIKCMHGYANVRVNGGAGLVGWAASDATVTVTATTMAVMTHTA